MEGSSAGPGGADQPGWALLAHALRHRQPVAARYHGHHRILCPHALGFHHGRAMMLAYQSGGMTSTGPLPPDPRRRWRLMFIDHLHDLQLVDQPWHTPDNYAPHSHGIAQLALATDQPSGDLAKV